MASRMPQSIIERTREWAFQFSAGEWFEKSDISDFMRDTFNLGGTTPQQYAEIFIRRGVENGDFESRHKQWRWVVHS